MPENYTLTVNEFCDRYRIDRCTYYRNAKLGRLPCPIKVGGATRILATDEAEWIARQRNSGLAQEGA